MTRNLPGPPFAWFAVAAAVITAWLYRAFVFDAGVMLFGEEMLAQSWQLREFAVSEVEAGRGVPLWNPYVFGGVPYVAILPGPVFYPTTLLYLVLPLGRAIGWTFVLHTWLAGLFGYFAARSIRLGRWASVVTGLSFMLTGFVTSMNEAGHDGRMFAMVLIPLAFGFLERGLRSGRLGWFLAMGLAVACQIFTPHLQMIYFSSLALSLYALVRVITMTRDDMREKGDWRPAARTFGYFALGFMAAALVGMAQLWPTLDLIRIAVRGGGQTGYEFAASWAMPPQELTGFVLPDLIGTGPLQRGAGLSTYWGSNPFKQHTEYLGIVPAALAVIGVTMFRRDRRVATITSITLLCVLFALGAATPVHRLAYAVVPMISKLRGASMMLGPAVFFLALLAGFGWQRVLDARENGESLPWGWIVGISAPALLLGLAAALGPEGLLRWVHTSWYPAGWSRRPGPETVQFLQVGGWLLVGLWSAVWILAYGVAERRAPREVLLVLLALLVVDLARVDARYIATIDPEEVFEADGLQRALQEEIDPVARVFQIDGYGPNEMMLYDIRSVTGMQNFRLAWTDRLLGGIEYRNLAAPALWSLLDLDYLITSQQVETPLLERAASGPRGTAWRVTGETPHAWFPRRVEAEPDSAAALELLLSRPDPADFALVAAGEGSELPAAGEGTARVTAFHPNEMVLEVDAGRGGLLVVSEIYHPHWHATVDGEEVPVYRTDVALRGVPVPEGRHEVRLIYSAGAVGTGLLVGLVALVASVAGIAFSVRGSRREEGIVAELPSDMDTGR